MTRVLLFPFLLIAVPCYAGMWLNSQGKGSHAAVAAGFGSTSVLDNFNRADENPMTGNWTSAGTPGYYDAMELISNQAADDQDSSGPTVSYWTPSTFGAPCEAYVTVATKPQDDITISVWIRIQDATINNLDAYTVSFMTKTGTDEVRLYRIDDDNATQLGATISQEVANGDSIGIECIGSTIKAYYKSGAGAWTEIGSRTDATYSGAGKIGIGGEGNVYRLDNFGGGTR